MKTSISYSREKMCLSRCSKKSCLPKILVFIVFVLILNLLLSGFAAWFSMRNQEINERQLFILNEDYLRLEQRRQEKLIDNTNSTENPLFWGEWKTTRTENFDRFLAKMGATWILQKIGQNSYPTIIIRKISPEVLQIKSIYPFKSVTTDYTMGKMETMKPPVGPTLDSITSWSGGRMVSYFSPSNEKIDPKTSGNTSIRELLDEDTMLMTQIYKGEVYRRWFKRVKKATAPAPAAPAALEVPLAQQAPAEAESAAAQQVQAQAQAAEQEQMAVERAAPAAVQALREREQAAAQIQAEAQAAAHEAYAKRAPAEKENLHREFAFAVHKSLAKRSSQSMADKLEELRQNWQKKGITVSDLKRVLNRAIAGARQRVVAAEAMRNAMVRQEE